jgi:hypothetical protein
LASSPTPLVTEGSEPIGLRFGSVKHMSVHVMMLGRHAKCASVVRVSLESREQSSNLYPPERSTRYTNAWCPQHGIAQLFGLGQSLGFRSTALSQKT